MSSYQFILIGFVEKKILGGPEDGMQLKSPKCR